MGYEFTGEAKIVSGVSLRRIRRADTGELGGWLEKESNLDALGGAWVSGEAKVFGEARVSGEARVFGEAMVSGQAMIFGNAQVFGEAWVSGEARVLGEAQIFGEARVSGKAWVSGEAWVFGKARVSGEAKVFYKAWVCGKAQVFGEAQVSLLCGCQDIFHGGYRMTVTETHVSVGCRVWTLPQALSLAWEDVKADISKDKFDALREIGTLQLATMAEYRAKINL